MPWDLRWWRGQHGGGEAEWQHRYDHRSFGGDDHPDQGDPCEQHQHHGDELGRPLLMAICVAGKAGNAVGVSGGGGGGGGGGSSVAVSLSFTNYEPSSWQLDIVDKNGVTQSLTNASSTANIDFTKDGSTYHTYDFSFSPDVDEMMDGNISVNGSNTISAEYQSDYGEGGDLNNGYGIQIDSGESTLVLSVPVTQPS